MKGETTLSFEPGSPEIAIRCSPSIPGVSSRDLNWKGLELEELAAPAGERPESLAPYHVLMLWRGPRNNFGEVAVERGRFLPYVRLAGTFTLLPAGVMPAVRSCAPADLLLCRLDAELVSQLRDELERPRDGRFRTRINFEDPATHRLVMLLFEEASSGGPSERLYADHLTHALILRIFALEDESQIDSSFQSALPRHILRRVTERIHDHKADLDLQTLAAEAGFSRRHFLRMFHKATGDTPHQYLIKLRLARAREFLRQRDMSLIDIALECGFASHSHMTTAFRRYLGVTPRELRRDFRLSPPEEP
jgi:AraC family transcriptional regulator